MLTRREFEVAELLARGLSRHEIAVARCVTVSAIDKLVHTLKSKLGASSQAMLVLRCIDHLHAQATAKTTGTQGALTSHRVPPPDAQPLDAEPVGAQPSGMQALGTVQPPDRSACAPFDPALGFEALFSRLQRALGRFGVTHLAYSHIRADGPGKIAHVASRWSMPAGVTYDLGLAPTSNPTFAYAMTQWAPLPLDLVALQDDAAYRFIPDPVRHQHQLFIDAGLVRGMIWPLPGLGVQDRLVLSGILRHASAQRFAGVLAEHGDAMRLIALDFRNAHVAMATPRHHLTEREAALLDGLADGLTLVQAGAAQGISRRAAERCLAAAREVTGAATTAALIALHLRNRSDPVLPF